MTGPSSPSRLHSLQIRNLRCFREVELSLAHPVIIFTGANGAGKTTLLEAIYLLARGRTFRGRKAGPPLATGTRNIELLARIRRSDAPELHHVHYRRDAHGTEHRVNGVEWNQGEIGRNPLAVKLIGENPQFLLETEPGLRRTLLDWNVFQVDHRMGRLRREMRRVLLQRNASLRSGGNNLGVWDDAWVSIAEAVTELRKGFFAMWNSQFIELTGSFPFLQGCQLDFDQGWDSRQDLGSELARVRETEIMRGYTVTGPNRADFSLIREHAPVRFSRGQAKTAVCLLQIAAEQVHQKLGQEATIWLLDDLEAELDEPGYQALWSLFAQTGTQNIMTRIDRGGPSGNHWGDDDAVAMFHVEHEKVARLDS